MSKTTTRKFIGHVRKEGAIGIFYDMPLSVEVPEAGSLGEWHDAAIRAFRAEGYESNHVTLAPGEAKPSATHGA